MEAFVGSGKLRSGCREGRILIWIALIGAIEIMIVGIRIFVTQKVGTIFFAWGLFFLNARLLDLPVLADE